MEMMEKREKEGGVGGGGGEEKWRIDGDCFPFSLKGKGEGRKTMSC